MSHGTDGGTTSCCHIPRRELSRGFQPRRHSKKQVKSLCDTFRHMGNPFLDHFPDLLTLDSRNCANESVGGLEDTGRRQYQEFVIPFILPSKETPLPYLNAWNSREDLEVRKVSDPPTNHNCRVTDGAAVVNCLPTASVSTFSDYAENIFIPYLNQQLQNCDRGSMGYLCSR